MYNSGSRSQSQWNLVMGARIHGAEKKREAKKKRVDSINRQTLLNKNSIPHHYAENFAAQQEAARSTILEHPCPSH
jgi:hypothetical protein